jgi:mannose-6-phosphate isomerase-like protein (cupin superfamily)
MKLFKTNPIVEHLKHKNIINPPKIVLKKWGSEVWIHNDEQYCGKILNFNEGATFSMHYHVLKNETWYVTKGKFLFIGIDPKTADKYEFELKIGDILEIERGYPHQLHAIIESQIFEISTQHFDDDSYRVEKGDSQK